MDDGFFGSETVWGGSTFVLWGGSTFVLWDGSMFVSTFHSDLLPESSVTEFGHPEDGCSRSLRNVETNVLPSHIV